MRKIAIIGMIFCICLVISSKSNTKISEWQVPDPKAFTYNII
ncbi:hypothetical protein C7459_11475 [Tumebacillus permanentifrigoris]|uniref:Uncharacterized protein n=1 Tax=Tumebacillus permanentifrigoris TaxID=378543 RepID=A0A316DA35_9BACL|nr:hypothetical protein C7459_11475 [Tumebacillus permanentifrigoris]